MCSHCSVSLLCMLLVDTILLNAVLILSFVSHFSVTRSFCSWTIEAWTECRSCSRSWTHQWWGKDKVLLGTLTLLDIVAMTHNTWNSTLTLHSLHTHSTLLQSILHLDKRNKLHYTHQGTQERHTCTYQTKHWQFGDSGPAVCPLQRRWVAG